MGTPASHGFGSPGGSGPTAARAVTLLQLRDWVRQRANVQKALKAYPDGEINDYINRSLKALYDLLILKYQDDYVVSLDLAITTSGTESTADLPDDFYKLAGVDAALNGFPTALQRYSLAERNMWRGAVGVLVQGTPLMRYQLRATQLHFIPSPPPASTCTLLYYPSLPDLADDGDTYDGVSGWEEFVILDAAIKVLRKEDSDATGLERDLARVVERIESAAANRDANEPMRAVDVRGWDY